MKTETASSDTAAIADTDGFRALNYVCLVVVVALSVLWFGWVVDAGLGNIYYTASARTIGDNPRWFFSGALDPAGFITIDKPPIGLWPTAIGIRVFGVNALGAVLPNAVMAWLAAFFASRIVERRWRWVTMCFVLCTPGFAILARSTLPDATMLAAGVGAAAILLKSSSVRSRVWAGALFGVAILAKPGAVLMLPAVVVWLVRRTGPKRVLDTALVVGGLLTVCCLWVAIAEVSPDRPYFGGTESDLAIEQLVSPNASRRLIDGQLTARDQQIGSASAGEPGPLRTLSGRMGRQAGYLLIFAVVASADLWRRLDRVDRPTVEFWLCWLVVHAATYSFLGGIAHAYYAASLAPAIGVLSTIAIGQLNSSSLLALSGSLVTLVLTMFLLRDVNVSYGLALGSMLFAAVIAFVLAQRSSPDPAVIACIFGVAGAMLLVTSSALMIERTTWFDPAAGEAQPIFTEPDAALRDLLRSGSGREFAVVTTNESLASTLIAEDGLPVALWGGFLGVDPVKADDQLRELLDEGAVGFVELSGRRGAALERVASGAARCDKVIEFERSVVRVCR